MTRSDVNGAADLLVVVVLDLHHLIAGREGPTEALDLTLAGRVQRRLSFDVSHPRSPNAERSTPGGAYHPPES